MANYILTNKAVQDLDDIWNYTIKTWSENQADEYYDTLIKSCSTIAQDPKIGKNYPDVVKELFGCKINYHIIFYRTISSGLIEIARILHERMDLKNRIKD